MTKGSWQIGTLHQMQAILTVCYNLTIELQSSFSDSVYNSEIFQAHSSFF